MKGEAVIFVAECTNETVAVFVPMLCGLNATVNELGTLPVKPVGSITKSV